MIMLGKNKIGAIFCAVLFAFIFGGSTSVKPNIMTQNLSTND